MSLRPTIIAVFQQVAADQGHRLAPLNDALPLLDSGLDSLGFAIVVARLEDELGVDPFSAAESAAFPVSFGDFVKAYELAR